LSITGKTAGAPPAYVTRDLCDAIRSEQREANQRTWEELRGLRRLVVGVVLGGQVLAGGLNVAGLAWWMDRQEAQVPPAATRAIEAARTEAREDVRDLRLEVRECLATIVRRLDAGPAPTRGKEEYREP
jgi:hypothetical protein